MAILTQDIKLFASDKLLSDDIDAGGDITQTAINSGSINTIFDPVSPLDRAHGTISLRKVFTSVFTQNSDKYYSAHSIVSLNPKDTKLNVCLFTTDDYHDRRSTAINAVEAYRNRSISFDGNLFGTQYKGSKAVKIFQPIDAPKPYVGQVLLLENTSTDEYQYIKVVQSVAEIKNFTVSNDTFQLKISNIVISQVLEYNFEGGGVTNQSNQASDGKIFETQISNSAKYYGSRPIESAIVSGQSFVKCDSVFTQLIPAALSQVALLDVSLEGVSVGGYSADSTSVTRTYSAPWSANQSIRLDLPVKSGTLSITGVNVGSITDNNGNLMMGSIVVGTIDYPSGVMLFSATAPTMTGTKTATNQTMPFIGQISAATSIPITNSNRGLVYVENLGLPLIEGSVKVSILAEGTWYDLVDNGAGYLSNEADAGSAELNLDTGSLSINLNVLPDVDSEIIIYYNDGASVDTNDELDNEELDELIENQYPIEIPLPDHAAKASITMLADYGAITITGNADGELIGDAGNETEYRGFTVTTETGSLLRLTGIPKVFTITYKQSPYVTETIPAVESLAFNLGVNLVKNSILIVLSVDVDQLVDATTRDNAEYPQNRNIELRDDGAGGIRGVGGSSVDYVTGEVLLNVSSIPIKLPSVDSTTRSFLGTSVEQDTLAHSVVDGFLTAASINADITLHATEPAYIGDWTTYTTGIDIDAVIKVGAPEIPPLGESLKFEISGIMYRVDETNKLYQMVEGGGDIEVGSYNPTTGMCTIDTQEMINDGITIGGTGTLDVKFRTVQTPLTRIVNGKPITTSNKFVFRIPEAPVQPSSLTIRGELLDGVVVTATSDINGVITGTGVSGSINNETGVVHLVFSGSIIRDTLTYNAVADSYISLSSDVLGINPVRLPENGKIRIFDEGDVVVVFNEDSTTATATTGATLNLSRGGLSEIRIIDADNIPLTSSKYTFDLNAGSITWGDMTDIPQPMTITHIIEDIAIIKEFRIDGTLTFTNPLLNDYPVAGTLVCNALPHNDLFASTSEPFDQKTWLNNWVEYSEGETTPAEFNTSIYPIVVTNASTIGEKWHLYFSSSTRINVVGETVGQILTGASIDSDIAPINPATGFPYFSISKESFGGGWTAGNVIRFNTNPAHAPIWAIQSVSQGAATNTDVDSMRWCLSTRGGVEEIQGV